MKNNLVFPLAVLFVSTFLQFAFVHYFTKYGFGEVYFSDMTFGETDDQVDSSDEDSPSVTPTASPVTSLKVIKHLINYEWSRNRAIMNIFFFKEQEPTGASKREQKDSIQRRKPPTEFEGRRDGRRPDPTGHSYIVAV